MIEIEPWSRFSRRLPLVAVVGMMGEWMTIYACLQQAIKNFDYVMIVGDTVTPRAKEMFDRFMSDYDSVARDRVSFIDLGELDPWPWVVMPRPNATYDKLEDVPVKSWSKAGFKRFNYARAIFPNSILCSLHSDVVVFGDTGSRIRDRIAGMENPFFDSEWFSMISMYDDKHIGGIVDPTSSPGNLKKHPEIKQRTWYDYPGDWGLMGYYASSMLSVGPDPQGHEAECFYPWSRKTQCEKKGFDDSVPHAIHYEWLRERYDGTNYKGIEWKIATTTDESFSDPALMEKLQTVKDVYFPVRFYLDENWTLRIENK
jgi:hypothetical protein